MTAAPLTAQVDFAAAIELSDELIGGASPGQLAAKCKLVRLVKTPGGGNDGRLIACYADAGHAAQVWEPKGKQHAPRDIYVRYSDDGGVSWSAPVNVSGTAGLHSAMTDWNGDGVAETYYGDSSKPAIFNNGNNVVITWADKYCPEPAWVWGQTGQSGVQGEVAYPDLATYPNNRVVPYAGMYAAVSNDGGSTWQYGRASPPLQLTYGVRDAGPNAFNKGAGPRWTIAWQEDPEGLQTGDAGGPGEGSSGAKVTQGTDIWYTFTDDIVGNAAALRDNRAPLSNHSLYDTSGGGVYETVGKAGQLENHGASRPNLAMVNDGTQFLAVVGYEETKGLPVLTGKTVQLHVFPFNQPPHSGVAAETFGEPGTQLTDLLENSRRVRFVTQQPNGVDPAIAVFWRQGIGDEGAPADIMLRMSTSLDPTVIAAAPLVNLSSNTPVATAVNLADATGANPIESARAHRAWIRGSFLVVGYSYTPNDPVARFTDLENYNFWIRRSVDSGASWLPPQDITNIVDTTINVKEPRIVGPAKTGSQDDQSFIIAWGTETNVYEGIGTVEPLDVLITRTRDQGATFESVRPVADSAHGEFESQLRINDDVSRVYAVWMESSATTEAKFSVGGNPLRVEVMNGPVPPGGTGDLKFHAPGFEGHPYYAGAAMGITPGIVTPFGTWAMNLDSLLQGTFGLSTSFVGGFQGFVAADGTAAGAVYVPAEPALSGLHFYVGFLAVPPAGAWGLSAPIRVDIL